MSSDEEAGDQGSLHEAAFLGQVVVLQRLLAVEGVDVDALEEANGQTPLYLAASAGHGEICRFLITTGAADPHAKVRSGSQAIHAAVAGKAPPAWAVSHGFGVLEHARCGIVEMLLDRDVDPNAVSSRGHTPLLMAARNSYVSVIRLLLGRGADPHHVGEDGKSAVDVAGNLECLHLLRRNIETNLTRHERYEVNGDKEVDAAYIGTRAVDIVSGERVLVMRFTDMPAYRRTRAALLALQGSYAGGHGALHHVPPPDDPPATEVAQARDIAKKKEERRMLQLALKEAAEEDEAAAVAAVSAGIGGNGTAALLPLGSASPAELALQPEPEPDEQGRPETAPQSFEARFAAMVKAGEGETMVVEGWTTRLLQYAHLRRNALPLAEVRAILLAMLRCLRALHDASLAHGAVSLHSVAKYWDGTWRLVDLHHCRPQGQLLDPERVTAFRATAEAQAEHHKHGSKPSGPNLGMLLKASGAAVSEGPKPLSLPSVPPELPRRAHAAVDIWAAGAVAAGLLTRTSCEELPCAAPTQSEGEYYRALRGWVEGGQQAMAAGASGMSDDARDLCMQMLALDPAERVSAAEAMELPFFAPSRRSCTRALDDCDRMRAGESVAPLPVPAPEPAPALEPEPEPEPTQQTTRSLDFGSDQMVEHESDDMEAAWREQLESVHQLVSQRNAQRKLRRTRRIILRDQRDSFGALRFAGLADGTSDEEDSDEASDETETESSAEEEEEDDDGGVPVAGDNTTGAFPNNR